MKKSMWTKFRVGRREPERHILLNEKTGKLMPLLKDEETNLFIKAFVELGGEFMGIKDEVAGDTRGSSPQPVKTPRDRLEYILNRLGYTIFDVGEVEMGSE